MAFNAQGFWTPENDDAGKAVSDVIASGGPLMKQARGLGMMTAGKRGLGNSSIAVGAAQAETMKAATPIGLQSAAQAHEKNLAALNANNQYKYGTDLAKIENEGAKDRLGMQIASTEKLSADEIGARMSELNTRIQGDLTLAQQGDAAAMARLQADLGSRAQLQGMQIAADKEMQANALGSQQSIAGMQIASNEKLSANEIAARMSELDKRIAGDKELAAAGDAAAKERLQLDLASREQLSAMEIGSREKMQTADIGARLAELDKRIAADKELAAAGDQAAMARLQADLASRAELQSGEIASREKLASQEIAARMGELDKRIEADKALAAQGDAAAKERLQIDLAARAQLQAQTDTAALQRQREEIAARADLSAAEREARLAEVDKQLASQKELATMDAAARQKLVETEGAQALERATLDANTRLDIAGQEADLARDRQALDAATAATNAYMQAMGQSMLNENIPADVRAAYQQSLEQATQANLALVNQVSGTALEWGSSNGPTNPAPAPGEPIMAAPAPTTQTTPTAQQQVQEPYYSGGAYSPYYDQRFQ